MKLLGCILIISSFSLFGIYKALSLNRRCTALFEIITVLENLKTEIGFLKKDLASALTASAENTKVFPLFKDFAEGLKTLDAKKAWDVSFEKNSPLLHLSKNDRDVLLKFPIGLGKTDTDNQIKHLEFIITLVSELHSHSVFEFKTKANIYKSMGVSLGTLTVILLI